MTENSSLENRQAREMRKTAARIGGGLGAAAIVITAFVLDIIMHLSPIEVGVLYTGSWWVGVIWYLVGCGVANKIFDRRSQALLLLPFVTGFFGLISLLFYGVYWLARFLAQRV
ncbi:MAG TPA: hypothetical protein VJG85_02730 [Patescibacteria group bacterium]|nr:hypothetical protein [Patescibacteria group bacterium]